MGMPLGHKNERLGHLKRTFVECISPNSPSLIISGNAFSHLGLVLRVKEREEVLVMDRHGKRALATVEEISKGNILLRIKQSYLPNYNETLKITVLQAILKGNSTDYLIQRLSELGVATIVFFKAKRSVVGLDKETIKSKQNHWDGICIRSYLQSDRFTPIEIKGPFQSLSEALELFKDPFHLKIVCHEKANVRPLRDLITEVRSTPGVKQVALSVGPEGGLEDEEVSMLSKNGFIPVRIGNRIFKAESTAIVLSAILQYELGDI